MSNPVSFISAANTNLPNIANKRTWTWTWATSAPLLLVCQLITLPQIRTIKSNSVQTLTVSGWWIVLSCRFFPPSHHTVDICGFLSFSADWSWLYSTACYIQIKSFISYFERAGWSMTVICVIIYVQVHLPPVDFRWKQSDWTVWFYSHAHCCMVLISSNEALRRGDDLTEV